MSENEFYEKVRESLQKKYRRSITGKFNKALKVYKLVNAGDRVAVCVSGGKDSWLTAVLFKELQKYSDVPFDVEYIVMDPGYAPENRRLIEKNAKRLGIPVHIFESSIFDAVHEVPKSPCYLCARMRRGYLYSFARELGCNKIALGHHYDDVIETTLMGMLYGAQVQGMMPKLHSTNFPGMELIRPLYFVREADIISWRDYNGLEFLRCACRFTEQSEIDEDLSKRKEIKTLISTLKLTHPDVEKCIFKSLENVNIDTVLAYKTGGRKHNFLDTYDKKK
ncbi:MAG: ATPase [Clostridia bacterium]|nr:ATPase [Clostridia bacterium]